MTLLLTNYILSTFKLEYKIADFYVKLFRMTIDTYTFVDFYLSNGDDWSRDSHRIVWKQLMHLAVPGGT